MREFSYFRLKKALSKAGFRSIEFYCGVRSYNNPKRIMNLSDKNDLSKSCKKFIERKISRMGLSVLLFLGLHKIFWPNFIVVCKA